MKKNKLAGAVFTLLVSAQANAAYCPMYLNETVQPMFINATLAMNAEIVAMDTALSRRIIEKSAGYNIQVKRDTSRNYSLKK